MDRFKLEYLDYSHLFPPLKLYLQHLNIDFYTIRRHEVSDIVKEILGFENSKREVLNSFIPEKDLEGFNLKAILDKILYSAPGCNKVLVKRYNKYKHYHLYRNSDYLNLEEYYINYKQRLLNKKKRKRSLKHQVKQAKQDKIEENRRLNKEEKIRKVDRKTDRRDVKGRYTSLSDQFEHSPPVYLKEKKTVKKNTIVKKGKNKVKKTPKEIYADLLKHPSWKKKRKRILKRDKFKCTECPSTIILQVHHLKYIPGKKPWEYSDKLLITLCRECHKKKHDL